MNKNKYEQEQQEKWENSTANMKKRKPHHKMTTNTKTMTRGEQVIISRWIYQSHSIFII
jgi:hypothetical protein